MTQQSPTQFPNLFSPLTIGSFTVRNRIVSTAHGTSMAENGLPSRRHADYWGSKAKGGIGLIVTESSGVHPSAGGGPTGLQLWRDDIIEPFKRVVDVVHQHGARLVAQMNHSGRSTYGASPLVPMWSASDVTGTFHNNVPREMTISDIRQVIEGFGAAAARMRKAELDGVEIHAAHDYLIQQFLSPLSNRRQDEYGGSEENRMRFFHEVIDAARAGAGSNFTIGIRIDGEQYEPGGLTQEDMQRIVAKLCESGKVDYVSVSFSTAHNTLFERPAAPIPTMYTEPGSFVYLAAGIKQVVDIPVFCIGKINNPLMAEEILVRNEADMVGMTRANIADCELPNKARDGRLDEIRYCIGCNEGCLNSGMGVTCAFNPTVGRESAAEIKPAPVSKKIMVIGGGVAGMEAARVAALRGHQVSIFEKETQLGGQLQIAAKAPDRGDFLEPIRFYNRQFQLLEVPVHLGVNVDTDLVKKENPDAVILATGGTARMPELEGLDQAEAAGIKVITARELLDGQADVVGDKVIVYATDQGMESLTTADYLADRGKEVEVMIPYSTVAAKVEQLVTRPTILGRLGAKGVKFSVLTGVKGIRDGAIIAYAPPQGPERRVEDVKTLVVACGSKANDYLLKQLQDAAPEVYAIGDCVSPRRILASSLDGLNIGLQV